MIGAKNSNNVTLKNLISQKKKKRSPTLCDTIRLWTDLLILAQLDIHLFQLGSPKIKFGDNWAHRYRLQNLRKETEKILSAHWQPCKINEPV